MDPILFQSVVPFVLSALIVVIITIVAEKYGTKVGGILGTLPSTIIIAFIFIAHNKGVDFASKAVAIVPAELGINLVFLFLFAILAYRSTIVAFSVSIAAWTILSSILFFLDITNIFVSLTIYFILLGFTFITLEHFKKIPSAGRVVVHYTPLKIGLRGVLAGIVIAISVLLSNLGAGLSGIFSVFPAIISSTMLISVREYGPDFAAAMAKSMIFGISSVLCYATIIHFLYPTYGVLIGTIVAFSISFVLTMVLFKLRSKIR